MSMRSILAALLFAGSMLIWIGASRAEQAPQFTLRDLDGALYSLEEELANGPIVIEIWATWCTPCIKMLPKLQEISHDYKDRGVRVFTINMDGARNAPKIRPFLQRHKLKLPVLIDQTNEVMRQFQLSALSATLIITPEGEVVYKHQGYKPGDEKKVRRKLDELLGVEKKEEVNDG